jgi:putative flippase GtrA
MRHILQKNKQAIRFGAVGIINTTIDFVLLFVLKSLGLPTIAANLLSSTTAFIFSFIANKNYTFRSTSSNIRRELVLFTIVTLTGIWVIQTLVIISVEYSLEAAGLKPPVSLLLAKIAATGVSLLWNYTLYSKVVFKNKD